MPRFGDDTYGSAGFPAAADRCLVTKFTLAETATVSGVWLAAGSTGSSNFKGVIIDDDGGSGEPGTVLHVGATVAVGTAGTYYESVISGSPSLSAGDYWLGFVADNFAVNYGQDASAGTETRMANGTFGFASPPGTWPGTDGSYNNRMNAYVEYTTGGGSATRGTALGHKGTAFNGGRTFHGIIQ